MVPAHPEATMLSITASRNKNLDNETNTEKTTQHRAVAARLPASMQNANLPTVRLRPDRAPDMSLLFQDAAFGLGLCPAAPLLRTALPLGPRPPRGAGWRTHRTRWRTTRQTRPAGPTAVESSLPQKRPGHKIKKNHASQTQPSLTTFVNVVMASQLCSTISECQCAVTVFIDLLHDLAVVHVLLILTDLVRAIRACVVCHLV